MKTDKETARLVEKECPLLDDYCMGEICIAFRAKGTYEAGDTHPYCMAMRCSIEK